RVHRVPRRVRLGCVGDDAGCSGIVPGRRRLASAVARRAEGVRDVRSRKLIALVSAGLLTLVACSAGTTVVARGIGGGPAVAPGPTQTAPVLSKGGVRNENLGIAPPGTSSGGTVRCATNADPSQGFTASTIKWGTIIPLSGTLRPLGEQTARAMQAAVDLLNQSARLSAVSPDWS